VKRDWQIDEKGDIINLYMKKKILIVDDEEKIVKAYSEYLSSHGYEVFDASDGEEGLAKIKEMKPDIILLDIIMPNMDGITMLKNLKRDSELNKIPVIMLTNLDTSKGVADALESGSSQYLVKSNYSLEDLKKRVEEVMQLSSF